MGKNEVVRDIKPNPFTDDFNGTPRTCRRLHIGAMITSTLDAFVNINKPPPATDEYFWRERERKKAFFCKFKNDLLI